MKVRFAGVLGVVLIYGVALAQELVPVGEQFQVNSYTTSYQWAPTVAAGSQGSFVVVWESYGSPGTDTGYSIQAQRYDASGTPAGGQFQVNSYTTGYQWIPSVAANAQGDFVVVWESYGSPGTDTDYSVQGQRYDASGTPAGGQFQVNSYTTSYQWTPTVAADSQGNFVVVWMSDGSPGTDTDYSAQGQRHDADGTPLGGQFQVNSYTTSYQRTPTVAADAQGNFVVVWASDGSSGTDTSYTSIQAQVYDSGGAPVGSQFQVNSYTTSYQRRPAVAADSIGNFVVVWASDGSSGTDTDYSIQAQVLNASGTLVGSQFQVNSYTTSSQDSPTVAADGQGGFVVVWQSDGSSGTDTNGTSIQAQRYSSGVLFVDGFESGDTSAWSSKVP